MRHRGQRNWQAWENIGASRQVLKWIREGVTIPFINNNRPPPPFIQGVSLLDATREHLTFVHAARFVQDGAWEPTTCNKYVSILFIVAKPGINQYRFIMVDLRHVNNFCVRKRLGMKSLAVRHLTMKGDYMFSFDRDGFYALGIVP
jgi:hypothetical protein